MLLRRQGHHRGPPGAGPGNAPAPALRAIDDFGRWVENADAKAALLAAGLGALGAGLVSQASLVKRTWHLAGTGTETPAVLLCAMLVSLAAALAELAWAVLPHLVPSGENRHSFPWVANSDLDTLTAPPVDAERDAWCHARLLARIAHAKLRHLRHAIHATGAATALFLAWFLVTAGLG